ncbi:MAG: hypothetical protein ACRDBG_22455, partial [Waterburya sp.]
RSILIQFTKKSQVLIPETFRITPDIVMRIVSTNILAQKRGVTNPLKWLDIGLNILFRFVYSTLLASIKQYQNNW